MIEIALIKGNNELRILVDKFPNTCLICGFGINPRFDHDIAEFNLF